MTCHNLLFPMFQLAFSVSDSLADYKADSLPPNQPSATAVISADNQHGISCSYRLGSMVLADSSFLLFTRPVLVVVVTLKGQQQQVNRGLKGVVVVVCFFTNNKQCLTFVGDILSGLSSFACRCNITFGSHFVHVWL